jgi:Domain of unknown function (DUF4401)
MNPSTLLDELKRRQLITTDVLINHDAPLDHTERPWYISALLGVCGWFAGIFVLVLAALMVRPDSSIGILFVGIFLIMIARIMYALDPKNQNAFVDQLALSFSIAGQFAVLFGASDAFNSSIKLVNIAATALVMQVALVFVMPNRLHRVLSTLFAVSAWAMLMRVLLWNDGDAKLFSSYHPEIAPPLSTVLLGWMITWLPLAIGLVQLVRHEAQWMARGWQSLVRPVCTGLVLGFAFATLISHPFESFSWGHSRSSTALLSILPLLSAMASVAAIAAAFAFGSRGLVGIGIVAALLHTSHFYYAMDTSLLIKSLMMLVLGAACLGVAWKLKPAPSAEQTSGAIS